MSTHPGPDGGGRLVGRDIILVSSDDFEAGLKTSKHQLTARLARHTRVLFVESIGLRRPRVSGKDTGRIARKMRRFLAGPQPREAGLWVFTPLAVPLHDRPWAQAFNRWFIARCVRRAARRLGFRNPLLWMFLPSAAGLVGRCGERLAIYYCVDDFAQFSGSNVAAITALDDQLTAAADVVFCSAAALADRKRRLNAATFYSPHGVDVGHFNQALQTPPRPADLPPASGPVIGYWGWIADYFDTAALAHLARQRPDWTILLIGEATIALDALRALPNVVHLGPRPYESLPAYAACCDVLLIPREMNDLTRSMNPLKLREYLATGRPVVSSPLPEVLDTRAKYGDAVLTASMPAEWLAAVEQQLAAGHDPAAVAALVADESWEARLDEVADRILAAEEARQPR
ncbi:MAG: glycosyltransferase [Fimbriimonadaceae bacterium]|nr:glycosyltransferase [Fimbriimonadaceae bacterium]